MDSSTMSTAGFYNSDGTWGPNKITSPTFELLKELKDTYTYPYEGWSWYDSVELAQAGEGFPQEVVDDINLKVYGEPEE